MALLQMVPFKYYTAVWWCLFSLSVTTVILLGLRFPAGCLRFLASFFANLSLVIINIWQSCIGLGKLVFQKIVGAKGNVQEVTSSRKRSRKQRKCKVRRPRQDNFCVLGTGYVLEQQKDCGNEDGNFRIVRAIDEPNKFQSLVAEDAKTVNYNMKAKYADARVSNEAPGYILKEDAQRHPVQHEKMKEAPRNIPSYITKEDAQPHQVQHENIKSAHGLKGVDSYVIQVLHFLECTSHPILGITGTHGVGKTALLWLVHDFLVDRSSMDYVFFLQLGRGRTLRSLQHSVLTEILGPQHNISNFLTAAKIISSSLKDKKFLLLLDDVREPVDLVSIIGLPMPLGSQQKVIFTTTDEAMCDEIIGCVGSTISMHSLGEEDAWSLFVTEVQYEMVVMHPSFKRLAKKIVQECQGLPVALVAFGQAMSVMKDVREWRYVCHLLEVKHQQLYNEIRALPYPSSVEFIWRLLK